MLVDDSLDGLLDIYEAARACREEVHRSLRAEVFDAVLDTLLSETLQELDELSTHTSVEGHKVNNYTITIVDDGLASEKWRGFLELKGNRNAEAEEFYQRI